MLLLLPGKPAERLKKGESDVSFPVGTFPPPQPFVQEVETLEPG